MTPRIPNPRSLMRHACLSWATILLTTAAGADDRDLIKSSGEQPYLFILFDVSGSMTGTPPDLLGPDGVPDTGDELPSDRWTPGYGDDPDSKFYQAKSALFRVLLDPGLSDIQWGFATYNQDEVRVFRKHFLYSPVEDPPWANDLPYPVTATPKHFGDTCMDGPDDNDECDLAAELDEVAWNPALGAWMMGSCGLPQSLADPESAGELVSFPVLGPYGTDATVEWVQHEGREFLVVWHELASGAYGDDDIVVRLEVRERDGCGDWISDWGVQSIAFTKSLPQDNNGRDLPGGSEMLIWQFDDRVDGSGAPAGFYNADDTRTSNSCRGGEPNGDSGADATVGVNLKYPTTADPLARHPWAFDRGDVIPWDWQDEEVWGSGNGNRDEILRRLAPSYDSVDPATADFRVAPYFDDLPDDFFADSTQGRLALDPAFVNRPPLIPSGTTPIGNSMYNFMQWFDQWKGVASRPDGDPLFGCRDVNLLILTDGDETCYQGSTTGTTDREGDRNPCWIADQLLNQNERDVRTFVIGFGVPGGEANFLDCIAERGGTSAIDLDNDGTVDVPGPILPGNEDDLVNALRLIANAVQSQSRSFASAAVPQAQANVDDKVYLTSFTPLAGSSIWPGRLDAYLRPVPLREQEFEVPGAPPETRLVPDPSQECGPDDDSQCHLWNAGEELLLQAADDAQLIDVLGTGDGDGSLNLGPGELERRVYYSIGSESMTMPGERRYFRLDSADPIDFFDDLLVAMDLCQPGNTECLEKSTKRDDLLSAMNFLHRIKSAEDPENPGLIFDFILGDFFHSDPVSYGNPDNFAYWVGDAEGSGTLPLQDPCETSPGGYRCFFAEHRYRRKVIFAGTNDGQMHAFDAGFFRGEDGDPRARCESSPVTDQAFVAGEFDNGTGRELFSFVPRAIMPTLDGLRRSDEHEFTVDGRIAHGDVFIDPVQASGLPDPEDREWRSTLVGTLREGGSGLYALDVTQPDVLIECDGLAQIPEARSGALDFVPSCLDGGLDCGPSAYPAVLWEFDDSRDCLGVPPELPNSAHCDDDNNGAPDLGDTWSRPTITRIRVDSADEGGLVDKYVAVFGGGLDPGYRESDDPQRVRGNFLFMVDMETGKAIYKRPVVGSVAADPAVVDTDQDGYADTIYFGTVLGFLYKVDIRTVPELEDLGGNGGLRITDPRWDPYVIFDSAGRAIYHEPAVLFVTELGRYALAFGTGEREDLWYRDPDPVRDDGRFYMFVDRDFAAGDPFLPVNDSDLQPIGVDDANSTADFLRQAPYGWYLDLEPGERAISEAFSLAGVTIFSTYIPEEIEADGELCPRFGSSRVYVVTTTASNTLLTDDLNNEVRYFEVSGGFLSPPFVETAQTKNRSDGDDGPTADDLPDNLGSVLSEIKKLLPTNCKFANYSINLKAVRDDTGIEFLAAIPICSVETNWKDF